MTKFTQLAPKVMDQLIKQFGVSVEDAAAILGNAGHESGGLIQLQEINPTVKGSRGGIGWFQWTAGRRRAFEKWADENGFAYTSNEASIGYLFIELQTSEKNAIPAVKRAKSLEDKVRAFEMAYERAGVKHYPSRLSWAKKALAAYQAAGSAAPVGLISAPGELPLTKTVIMGLQSHLRDLGYFEVGIPDGIYGARTKAAAKAFQAVEGLPETGELDTATISRMETAEKRPVSAERAGRTMDDLRKGGAQVIQQTDKAKSVVTAAGGVGFFGSIYSAVTTYFSDTWESLAFVRDAFSNIPSWVWFVGVFLVCIYLWRRMNSAQLWRLDDERTGRHNGIPVPPEEPEDKPHERQPEPA